MRIRIRIQQLKLMRIHADPDTKPDPTLVLTDKKLITYNAEVGGVSR